VVKVFKGLPAAAVLKDGDVIVRVAGQRVTDVSEMSAAIAKSGVGKPVEFEVLRGSERKRFTIKPAADSAEPGRPIIGIRPDSAYTVPVEVFIDSQDIVGPSAGLMFSLALVDAMTEADLTRGHRIAGTGTIELDGRVGPIGGVEEKVRAAEYADADIFLAPPENYDAARKTARDIRVYKVATLREAVDLLESLRTLKQ
jgi:PDZ domain-containing protein